MSALDDMAEELAVHGIHVGFREQRAELSRRMLAAGVSTDDVAMLAKHCTDSVREPGGAARVLASLLVDDAKREQHLADLRLVAEAKAKRTRAFGDKAHVPGPTEGEPREVWDHDRMCRIAWCMHNGDRKPRAEIARTLGVQAGMLEAMLARGEQLSRSPLVERAVPLADVRKLDQDEEARRQQFREQMRKARQVSHG